MARKKITHIERCICSNTEPVILTHNCIGTVEYTVKCLNCGRGGIFYKNTKTTYQACKKWNEMQKKLKELNLLKEVIFCLTTCED